MGPERTALRTHQKSGQSTAPCSGEYTSAPLPPPCSKSLSTLSIGIASESSESTSAKLEKMMAKILTTYPRKRVDPPGTISSIEMKRAPCASNIARSSGVGCSPPNPKISMGRVEPCLRSILTLSQSAPMYPRPPPQMTTPRPRNPAAEKPGVRLRYRCHLRAKYSGVEKAASTRPRRLMIE